MIKKILITLMISSSILLSSLSVSAQNYQLKEITPEVKASLDARKERYDEIQLLKSKGKIGENNEGYIELLVKMKDKEVSKLIKQENKDRKVIYQAIADQNNIKEHIKVIEEVFAQVQMEKAVKGEKVQNKEGKWFVKE